jgi:transposase
MHEAGLSFREIARRVSRSDSIIIPACRAWLNEGLERHRKGGGRPRIMNQRTERRHRRLASVNSFEIIRSVEASYLKDCFGKAGVYANNLSQNPFT